MVDWRKLFENWKDVPDDLKKSIFDEFLKKNPDQLKDLFMREPFAKAVWNLIPEAQRFPPKPTQPLPLEKAIDIFPFLKTDSIPMPIPKLIYTDNLIITLFNQLNERLQGPPTEFVIKHVATTRYVIDGYAGFKGQIVFSINDSKKSSPELKNDDIAYVLIHEILHKTHPEASEKMIEEQLLPQAWESVYPHHPNPNTEYKTTIEVEEPPKPTLPLLHEKGGVTPPAAPVVKPTVAPPRPTKVLAGEDMKLLAAYFNTQLMRALGKVPPGASSVFLVEFQEVKMLPFNEAKERIMSAADRLADDLLQQQRARTVIRQGERVPQGKAPPKKEEEGMPANIFNRPPATFPLEPLGHGRLMPFPRGPTSEERARLWNVFCTQIGAYCNDYQRQFEDYIENSQFLSWEDLQEQFKFFTNTIKEGADLPPLVVWRRKLTTPTGLRGELRELEPSPTPSKLTQEQIEMEEANVVKRQRILIAHWAAALIHQGRYYGEAKTLSDLYDEVVDRGVIDASIPLEIFVPNAKEAIRQIYSEPLRKTEIIETDGEEEVDKLNLAKVPFVGITQEEIDAFLSTS